MVAQEINKAKAFYDAYGKEIRRRVPSVASPIVQVQEIRP
jgi:hypothetical protein